MGWMNSPIEAYAARIKTHGGLSGYSVAISEVMNLQNNDCGARGSDADI